MLFTKGRFQLKSRDSILCSDWISEHSGFCCQIEVALRGFCQNIDISDEAESVTSIPYKSFISCLSDETCCSRSSRWGESSRHPSRTSWHWWTANKHHKGHITLTSEGRMTGVSNWMEGLIQWKVYGPEEKCLDPSKDILEPILIQDFTQNNLQPTAFPRGCSRQTTLAPTFLSHPWTL